MSRELSKKFKANANKTVSCDPLIILCEISHPDLSTDILLANWIDDVESNNQNYISSRFDWSFPSDKQGEKVQTKFRFDNIGRELTQWIEQSCGARCGQMLFKLVTKDCPDEVIQDYCFKIESVCMTCISIEATLVLANYANQKSMQVVFNECTAPGLP